MSGKGIPCPDQAIVLAAGLGTRMRPLTNDRPKPLVTVAGRTLIDHVLDRLVASGIGRAVVNLHYRADQLEAHLKERSSPCISLSDERAEILDSGGGVKQALRLLKPDPFFTINADAIWTEPGGSIFRRMAEAFAPSAMDELMLVVPLSHAVGYAGRGDFYMDADGRLSWPTPDQPPTHVWTGIRLTTPAMLDGTPGGAFSWRILWDRAMAQGRLRGLVHDGYWLEIGTPQGVTAAEEFLARNSL